MSEILSDIKKLDRTSIAAAIIILLVVIGLLTTLVVVLTRPSGGDKAATTPPSAAVSKPQTSTTAPTTPAGNTASTKPEAQPNTQTAANPATEAPSQTESASNASADASLPADLTVLTALDPDRFAADSYQISELRFGHGNIYGTVKSSTQEMFNNITLEITLYDAKQAPTGVCTVKLTNVKPGSNTQFVQATDSRSCTQYRITGYIAS